jgi:hypothetical protein
MYRVLIWLHILSATGFMLSHGASVLMAFQIRREEKIKGMRALLDASGALWIVMGVSLLLLLVSGVASGIMGRWWGDGWIWLSVLVLIAITVVMGWFTGRYYHPIRRLVGLPYMDGSKEREAEAPAPEEEIRAAVAETRPGALFGVGGLGTALILWLMIFKPF